MNNDNASPLNHLAATAIAFAAGVAATLGFKAWTHYVETKARESANDAAASSQSAHAEQPGQ